jgi:hypothetical protein
MPVAPHFNQSSGGPAQPKSRTKRRPPFGLRLTDAERARLVADAKGLPLGTYIKDRLFDTGPSGRKRRKGLSIQDREALARALALLGRSRLSSNLNQLAHAVNIGVLPVTPETEAELFACVQEVRDIRRLLMSALGHDDGGTR